MLTIDGINVFIQRKQILSVFITKDFTGKRFDIIRKRNSYKSDSLIIYTSNSLYSY